MGGQGERRVCQGLLAAVMLAAGLAAHAASSSGAMPVTAKVASKTGCLILNAGSPRLDFGTIDQASTANATATTTVVVRCRGNLVVHWTLGADNGLNPTGAGVRRLRHATIAGELMPYTLGLSPDDGWSILFGTSNTTVTLSGTITPANFQSVASGDYTDSVKLTLNF